MRRVLAYLSAHPVLCLLLLTPGIPEYLSSSSPIAALVLNPGQFVFQLVANLGLYGTGVLLVREAIVRRKAGWPSVLLFGAAYGILEEGVALSTLFNPTAGPVGVLGSYGHFLGVSWVWAIGVLMIHVVYSVGLPIALHGIALPSWRGRPLLGRRGLAAAGTLLALDVGALIAVVDRGEGFWMGYPLLVGALAAVVGLTIAGFWAVRTGAGPGRDPLRFSDRGLVALGIALFPATLFGESLLGGLGVPAAATFVALGAFDLLWIYLVLPDLHGPDRDRRIVALAAGLLVPILVIGLLVTLYFPIVLVADGVALAFLYRLYRRAARSRPAVGIAGPTAART